MQIIQHTSHYVHDTNVFFIIHGQQGQQRDILLNKLNKTKLANGVVLLLYHKAQVGEQYYTFTNGIM